MTTMDYLAMITLLAGVGYGSFLGGYQHGVKDTERRWSEAVTRAEEHRRYPT
jgi:hypothetical protein